MSLDHGLMVSRLDKRKVRTSFGRAALNYDDFAALQRRIGDALFDCLGTQSLTGASTALDLGAGTGYCSRRLVGLSDSVIALDIASAMLTLSNGYSNPNIFHVCGDAELIPLADRSVDLVFSNLAIQWCMDLDQLFGEIYRVLSPGGILVFSSFGPDTLNELKAAWTRVDDYSHVNSFYPPALISRAMQRTGLTGSNLERKALSISYDSVLHLMGELKAIGAHNVTHGRPRGLTGKQKIARMISAYENLMPGAEIFATFDVLYGRARRPGLDC